MKTTTLLIAIASISSAVLPFSIFFTFATTATVIVSVTAWLALGFVKSYSQQAQSVLPRMRTGMMAAAVCCPKSSLRLAA